jgi:hypothetical protein
MGALMSTLPQIAQDTDGEPHNLRKVPQIKPCLNHARDGAAISRAAM